MKTSRTLLAFAAAALCGLASPAMAQPAHAADVKPAAVDGYCYGMTWLPVAGGYHSPKPTTSNGSGNTNCLMTLNVSGNGVRELRLNLYRCYDVVTNFDAPYDAGLRDIIRYFQAVARNQGYNIAVDGIFGPQTSAAMKWHQFFNGTQFGCTSGAG